MAGRATIMLRLVRIGMWTEIAAAAASISRQSRAQRPIVEFSATPRAIQHRQGRTDEDE
jgi:hypothetical protein